MKHKVPNLHEALPPEPRDSIREMGENIRLARKRRNWTMEEMASRMFVSRQTLSRLEQGDAGASLAVLASALWVLGLNKQLDLIADPEKDKVGIYLERKNQPERVRQKKKLEADF